MTKKLVYFLPSLVIMSIIFYLSSLPSTGIGGNLTCQFIINKSLHIFVYSLLSISFCFGLSHTTTKTNKFIFIASIFFSYIYGLSDEFHQTFVDGRGGKFSDSFFDLGGAFIGVYLFDKYLKKFLYK